MVFGSFTLYDLLASWYLVLVFLPILLVPGYVIGWGLQLFGFRQLSLAWRLLIAVPLSIGLSPIIIYLLGNYLSWKLLTVVFVVFFLLWISLLAGLFGHEKPSAWLPALTDMPRFGKWTAAAWLAIALCSLVDLQIGHRLYFSVVSYDYSVRTAITDAISRGGVHPNNPFYALSGPAPLRYHYFWFLPCSLAAQWSGLSNGARLAMNASVVWCGWGLMSLVPLYFRFIMCVTGKQLLLRSKCGVLLFAVTGLDIIPTVLNWFRHVVNADLEWWNGIGQITSWIGTLLWVPHNAAALISGLMALVVLWNGGTSDSPPRKLATGLVAGAVLASMVGDSVYVALVVAAFLCVWTVVVLARREFAMAVPLIVAGLAATVLAAPYVLGLAGQAGGSTFVKLASRNFGPLLGFVVDHHLGWIRSNLLFLLVLPVAYLLELGVFLLVPILYFPNFWRFRNNSWMLALTLLAVVPFLIATFVKSSVVPWSNDLGWRGFLPVQFVLLLWGADLIAGAWEQRRSWFGVSNHRAVRLAWAAMLIIGVSSSLFELFIIRTYGMLADAGLATPLFIRQGNLGEITYGLRLGYEKLNQLLPAGAIIQGDPRWQVYDYFLGLYSHHPTASFNMSCGVELGGEEKACKDMYATIEGAFERPASYSLKRIETLGEQLHARALVVYRFDPAWNGSGWVQQLKPAVQTDAMKAYLLPGNSGTNLSANARHLWP